MMAKAVTTTNEQQKARAFQVPQRQTDSKSDETQRRKTYEHTHIQWVQLTNFLFKMKVVSKYRSYRLGLAHVLFHFLGPLLAHRQKSNVCNCN